MSVVSGAVNAAEQRAAARERMPKAEKRLLGWPWLSRWLWPWAWLAVVLVLALLGVYNGVVYHPHLDQPHRFAIIALLFYIGLAGTVVWCGLLLGLLGLRWLRLADGAAPFAAGERLALAAGLAVVNGANGAQVTYNGHPLYTFIGDKAAGQANGEGIAGKWVVATPDLKALA